MAETCIVCLGDLRNELDNEPVQTSEELALAPSHATRPGLRTSARADAFHTDRIRVDPACPRPAQSAAPSDDDDGVIAHLLPCKHDLHNTCLKPWVERANSCPICRAVFNEVELKDSVGGPTLSSYAVQDKQQQADLDPLLVIDDDIFEEDEPCIICTTVNNAYEAMYCDGCDRTVHVFCAGCQEAPDVWYCAECITLLDTDGDLPLSQNNRTSRRANRRQDREATERPRRQRRAARRPNSDWARVWQSVWNNLNLDLDFPFDEEPVAARRTPAQRRDFNAWQRRLRVANQHGAAHRFRDTATALLEQPPPQPESQEELRAWNAFDKARELQGEPPSSSHRKRKATTESPASPKEADATPQRPLKRPRTRRMLPQPDTSVQAESSIQAASRVEGPSFLTSLLQEVERQQPLSDQASPTSMGADDQNSPGAMSSPEGSPVMTGHSSPRAGSATPPPPLALPRPSYTPLTSIVRPLLSPPLGAYSPFSPADKTNGEQRGRATTRGAVHNRDSSPQSPASTLSYSTKAEIQRMVKTVLKPAYLKNEVTAEEYTDINRDVSRALYEHVQDAADLADYDSRNRLQALADELVQKAIEGLKS